MRYLLDFTVVAGGGSSTYATGFLQELARRCPPPGGCMVLLPSDSDVLGAEEVVLRSSGYAVRRPPTGRPGTLMSGALRQVVVPWAALRCGAAVIFVPRETAPILLPRRVVLLAHNLAAWERHRTTGGRPLASWFVRNLLARASVARSAVVMAVSATFAERIPVDRGKVRVVHHGCDVPLTEASRPTPVIRSCPLHIICLGTLYPHKRFDVTIRAVRLLRDGGRNVRLSIWGGSYSEGETAKLRSLGLSELGYDPLSGRLPRDQRERVLADADVMAMGSSFESFGLPMVEAMRTSTIVWAPASALATELCHEWCATYREGDWRDGARQLEGALARAPQLVVGGRHRSMDFTWERCVDKTVSTLREVARAG